MYSFVHDLIFNDANIVNILIPDSEIKNNCSQVFFGPVLVTVKLQLTGFLQCDGFHGSIAGGGSPGLDGYSNHISLIINLDVYGNFGIFTEFIFEGWIPVDFPALQPPGN